jgi:DNA-binding LytR/AlgR family response regulator
VIQVVLVDDEIPAVERLKKLLKTYEDFQIVGEAHDGLSALEVIDSTQPQVVFLDIDMPELNGLEVARTLGVHGPLIVFVTAHDEHALAAFQSSAIDYLVKPVNTTRLDFTIEKVRRSLVSGKKASLEPILSRMQAERGSSQFAVKVGAKYEIFTPGSIAAALSQDHYTSLIVDGRELLSSDSMELILTRLDPNIFIRVHRSAFINMNFLKELKREGDRKFVAVLSDKSRTQVPVSRDRLPQLKKILGLE